MQYFHRVRSTSSKCLVHSESDVPRLIFCCCRILNAFAEEQATEDAIFYLGEALRKQSIDLDVYLRVSEIHQSLLQ